MTQSQVRDQWLSRTTTDTYTIHLDQTQHLYCKLNRNLAQKSNLTTISLVYGITFFSFYLKVFDNSQNRNQKRTYYMWNYSRMCQQMETCVLYSSTSYQVWLPDNLILIENQ